MFPSLRIAAVDAFTIRIPRRFRLNHEIFARNFRSLLLTPPLRNKRVLAVDPGTRAGTKAVALDERGTPLEDVTTHPLPPQNKVPEAKASLANLIPLRR